MMRNASSTLHYIIPEGSTREESCTWEEIKDRVAVGRLSLDSLLFDSEARSWIKIGSITEFSELHRDFLPEARGIESVGGSVMEELKEQYEDVSRQLESDPHSLELLMKAGRIALSMDDKDNAFRHYQEVLYSDPFNERITREIKRSFSRQEYKSFSYLERKPQWWEDFAAVTAFPLRSGWKGLAVVTACLSLLLFIPWGGFLYWLAAALIGIHVIEGSGRADFYPFSIDSLSGASFRQTAKSFAVVAGTVGEVLFPFVLIASISLLATRTGHYDLVGFIKGSPILIVAIFTLSAAYLPAAVIVSTRPEANITCALNPSVVFGLMKAMDVEYLISAAYVAATVLIWILLRDLLSALPVAGEIIATGALIYGQTNLACVLGRLQGRYRHVLSPPPRSTAANNSEVHRPGI